MQLRVTRLTLLSYGYEIYGIECHRTDDAASDTQLLVEQGMCCCVRSLLQCAFSDYV